MFSGKMMMNMTLQAGQKPVLPVPLPPTGLPGAAVADLPTPAAVEEQAEEEIDLAAAGFAIPLTQE